ncbi:hypothetical protein LNP26_27200 [Klebsiella variicola subsp. variicola]|nr:hypothetical protein [Klebsiella variicola subsp. variicola]
MIQKSAAQFCRDKRLPFFLGNVAVTHHIDEQNQTTDPSHATTGNNNIFFGNNGEDDTGGDPRTHLVPEGGVSS